MKPTNLGCCGSLAGESRLCLTASSLLLVGLNPSSYSPPVDFPLLSVRRFGHTADSFYLELGRSAPHGPGEIWMELKDKGDFTHLRVQYNNGKCVWLYLLLTSCWFSLLCEGNAAQLVHEKVRVAVRELRALPDFGHSPPCGGQKRSTFKRYRRKYSKKLSNPKSPHPSFSETPRGLDASCTPSAQSSASSGTPSCSSQTSDDYMEMRRVRPARERERWETSEDESVYMVMSPQPRCNLPVFPPEDYTVMESEDEEWPAGPSHRTSMNR